MNYIESTNQHHLIPLDKITVEENYSRPVKNKTEEDKIRLSALTTNIAEVGLLQPIGVRIDSQNPGFYILCFGNQRLSAFRHIHAVVSSGKRDAFGSEFNSSRFNSWSSIPAIVFNTSDQIPSESLFLVENCLRFDISNLELCDLLWRLQEEYWKSHPETKPGATGGGNNGLGTRLKSHISDNKISDTPVYANRFRKKIAGLLGYSESKIGQIMTLRYLENKEKEKLSSGEWTQTGAYIRAAENRRRAQSVKESPDGMEDIESDLPKREPAGSPNSHLEQTQKEDVNPSEAENLASKVIRDVSLCIESVKELSRKDFKQKLSPSSFADLSNALINALAAIELCFEGEKDIRLYWNGKRAQEEKRTRRGKKPRNKTA